MSLPRLGNAIIINNVSKSVPGSEEDVKRLKEMYETVGFDVFVYRDPSSQVNILSYTKELTKNVRKDKLSISSL